MRCGGGVKLGAGGVVRSGSATKAGVDATMAGPRTARPAADDRTRNRRSGRAGGGRARWPERGRAGGGVQPEARQPERPSQCGCDLPERAVHGPAIRAPNPRSYTLRIGVPVGHSVLHFRSFFAYQGVMAAQRGGSARGEFRCSAKARTERRKKKWLEN